MSLPSDKFMSRAALALHRQNPNVLSIEEAHRYLEQWIPEVIAKGRASEDKNWYIGTAGFEVTYSESAGYGEVGINLNLGTIFLDSDGTLSEEEGEFEWSAMRTLSGVDTDSTAFMDSSHQTKQARERGTEMTPNEVNALLTKTEPLTEAERQSLLDLPLTDLLLGNGVEPTPFGEPNREFLADLFESQGLSSYRLSL